MKYKAVKMECREGSVEERLKNRLDINGEKSQSCRR